MTKIVLVKQLRLYETLLTAKRMEIEVETLEKAALISRNYVVDKPKTGAPYRVLHLGHHFSEVGKITKPLDDLPTRFT